MSKLLIFHTILPGCEQGNAEAWTGFLTAYTPTALEVFRVYSHWSPATRLESWRDVLHILCANDYAALRGFSHQSEREFLVGLRAFLQDFAAARLRPSEDATDPVAPTVETLGALLSGLPLLHQEIAFLALAGYSQKTLERILRITPAVAEEGLGRLRTNYSAVIERTDDQCLWPAAWISICRGARADEQKDCAPLRQLIRILDGQASWYDKSPAEIHRAKCLHCLELWTSLLEVVGWDKACQPWSAEQIAPLLAAVPLQQEKRKSLFARMLGK